LIFKTLQEVLQELVSTQKTTLGKERLLTPSKKKFLVVPKQVRASSVLLVLLRIV